MSIIGNPILLSGGSSPTPTPENVQWKDVNFIDYNGTLLYSYTASEFQALTTMPDNPSHKGLIAQGWNWTLAGAKEQVSTIGKCIIGQMYTTSDGSTRIYIHLEEGRLDPYCGFGINGTAVIDWGDGSSSSTVTGTSLTTVKNTQHTYAAPGDYVIKIRVSSGSISLFGSSSYYCYLLRKGTSTNNNQNRIFHNSIKAVEIGNNCSIGNYAFYNCTSLLTITIPNTIGTFGTYAFYYCTSLLAFIVPKATGTTTLTSSMFYNVYGLDRLSLSESITTIDGSCFYNGNSLAQFVLSKNLTTIGSSAFRAALSLFNIVIPTSITTLEANTFYGCYGLASVKFLSSTPPTIANSNAFSSISTDCKFYVPSGSLSDYTSATNYPSSSTYTYVEY